MINAVMLLLGLQGGEMGRIHIKLTIDITILNPPLIEKRMIMVIQHQVGTIRIVEMGILIPLIIGQIACLFNIL